MGAAELLDLLFPRRCPFCGGVNPSDLPCEHCQQTLPWLVGPAAHSRADYMENTVSALGYQGAVRDGVIALKFHGKLARAKPFGVLVAQCVHDHYKEDFDLISWPPLSAKRLRKRGYDQAELLAEEVAKSRGGTAVKLFKKEHRPAQSGLTDAAQRRANILGAYHLLDAKAVAGKRVLLIDDVVTTGATLSECARVLRAAGAARVCAATLAKAGLGKDKTP